MIRSACVAAIVLLGSICVSAEASIISSATITALDSSHYSTRTAAKVLDGLADTSSDHEWLTDQFPADAPAGAAGQWIKFDLGQSYTLASMSVWNCDEVYQGFAYTPRGVRLADIRTASSASDYTNNIFTTVSGLAGVTIAQAPGADPYTTPTVITFPAGVTTRYVEIYVQSNWAAGPGTQKEMNYVGLSEVQFTASDVPEPLTLSLLCAGGLGIIARRRRA